MSNPGRTEHPSLTLWISRYGGWDYDRARGSMTKVVFTGPDADAIAADYVARKSTVDEQVEDALAFVVTFGLTIELDEDTDVAAFPATFAALFPSCEHGMDGRNCMGPEHFMSAEQERALWG